MTLLELKVKVDQAIEYAKECGESPDKIEVSLQIDVLKNHEAADCVFSQGDVELHYDNNLSASGCVLTGIYHLL